MNKYENWIELKPGMLVRVKKNLGSSTRNWNNPKRAEIKENTVLMIPSSGTNYGDVGPTTVGIMEDGKFVPSPSLGGGHSIATGGGFLREGHTTRCPYDLGLVDPSAFEVVGQLEGKLYEFYRSQAPHITHRMGVQPLVLIQKDGEFCFAQGHWEGWALCYNAQEGA